MVMKNISWKMVKCKRWMLYGLTGVCLLGGFSCTEEYDDTWIKEAIEDLQDRVTALEDWCQTANSNISSLRSLATALEECDYITGVTPVTENGVEIGYTITFKDAPAIIIYHGQDGEKGDSASVPMIGVSKGDDGRYYWTQTIGDADPEFILDEAGKKIAASGMAPRLSVDSEGYWLIDANGDGFVRLKDVDGNDVKAVGEKGDAGEPGETGPQGPAGNSIFSKVDYSDPTYVIFYLNDGTRIQLPRYNLTDTQAEYDALTKAISEATGTPDNPTVIELTGDILMGENDAFVINGNRHIVIDGKGHKIDRGDKNTGFGIFTIEAAEVSFRNINLEANEVDVIKAYGSSIISLENNAVVKESSISLNGADLYITEGSIIENGSISDGYNSGNNIYIHGGTWLNSRVYMYVYEKTTLHISEMPYMGDQGKMDIIVIDEYDENFKPIIAPVGDCQLDLNDFNIEVWPDGTQCEIIMDNDGIIKLRLGE